MASLGVIHETYKPACSLRPDPTFPYCPLEQFLSTRPADYVDHLALKPGKALFRHFIENIRGLTGMVHGRRIHDAMRYGFPPPPRNFPLREPESPPLRTLP